MASKHITDAQKRRIVELVAKGEKTQKQIADEVGVSKSSIHYVTRTQPKRDAKAMILNKRPQKFVQYAPVSEQKIEIEYAGFKFRIAGSDRDGLRNLIALIKEQEK